MNDFTPSSSIAAAVLIAVAVAIVLAMLAEVYDEPEPDE